MAKGNISRPGSQGETIRTGGSSKPNISRPGGIGGVRNNGETQPAGQRTKTAASRPDVDGKGVVANPKKGSSPDAVPSSIRPLIFPNGIHRDR